MSTLETVTELVPHTQEIFDECPRFRILVLGKSGAGKSSLINCAFNVDLASVSHSKPGESNIEDEILSPENPHFVLHDSKGFEAGETENVESPPRTRRNAQLTQPWAKFAIIENFIQDRKDRPQLRDRLHAIWLCIEIPVAGGGLLEACHELFFDLKLENIPVVIVFTKYDKLFSSVKLREMRSRPAAAPKDMADRTKHYDAQTNIEFEKICIEPLTREFAKNGHQYQFTKVSTQHKYRDTVSELVKITRAQATEAVGLIGAIAQRSSVDLKIQASITVGRNKYWRGLASSAHFPGVTLQRCLHVIHSDIIATWNMFDPEKLLQKEEFEAKIANCVEGEKSPKVYLHKSLAMAGAASGIAGAMSGPAAPIVTPTVFAGIMIANWVYETYKETPVMLCRLMSYIVDSIIIMQSLFSQMASQRGRPQVTSNLIDTAVRAYKESDTIHIVHKEIQDFSQKAMIPKRDDALDKVLQLIKDHRFDH